jgi:hypothetical protein
MVVPVGVSQAPLRGVLHTKSPMAVRTTSAKPDPLMHELNASACPFLVSESMQVIEK